jgi:DNA-binding MarR family transcriptional regulator
MLVMEDIATHPDSSISEITARTGFPQSHVSTSVARFHARGIVETRTDPADGRRTLVRAAPDYVRRAGRRGTQSVNEAVAAALDDPDPIVIAEVVAALDRLADLLTPGVRDQMASLSRTPRRRTTTGDPRNADTNKTKGVGPKAKEK